MEFFSELGYIGLFIASFLAATILPLSSEIVLSILLLNELNPIILLTVATLGNVLGALTNYAIGFWGGNVVAQKVLKISEDEFKKSKERFQKFGLFSLFFAWVPIIGDPLTVVAGALRIKLLWFFILVASGKCIRYIVIIYTTLQLKT
jgi:membrane protein YqaA with SNARE-associated domain